MMEEFRAQWVYIALPSLPLVEVSSSHIGGDEDRPNSIASTEAGGHD